MFSVEVGDVVQLESGGPKMVVTYIDEDADGDCACRWFVGSVSNREIFPMASLMLVSPD
jgi:uncharacterized protein YodC (DUF2158 family)